jgi:hypothetical protein
MPSAIREYKTQKIYGNRRKVNTGAFNVVVILWEQRDYEQIADFFATLKNQNPVKKGAVEGQLVLGIVP